MANTYGGQKRFGGQSSTATSKPAMAAGSKESAVVFSTGLFSPKAENSKAIGTVQVKETITIPAGSYVNLYENDRSAGKENAPAFRIQVRTGVLKKQA